MRDLNADLRGTFLIVVGILVCLSVIVGLLLLLAGAPGPGQPSGPRWRTLPSDRSEPLPAAQPAKPAGPAK